MQDKTKYKFELNMADPCNYIYKEKTSGVSIGTHTFTSEQMQGYAAYIRKLASSLPKGRRKKLHIYGGDLIKNLSSISVLAENVISDIDLFVLNLDSKNLQPHLPKLLDLRKVCGNKLRIDVIHKFSMDSDYDPSTLYTLQWLIGRNITEYIIVPVSISDIHLLGGAIEEFSSLLDMYPHIMCEVVLDYGKIDNSSFDTTEVTNILSDIKDRILQNKNLEERVVYCTTQAVRNGQLAEAPIGNILSVMVGGGAVYPGYDIPFMKDTGVSELAIGNVSEGANVLFKNRSTALSKFKTKVDITDLSNLHCSVPPLAKVPYDMYNMIPTESEKQLHATLSTYLSTRGV